MANSFGGLSRRDVLRLGGLGLLGLLLPSRLLSFFSDLRPDPDPEPPLQGRILANALWSYDAPSSGAQRVKFYWRDLIVDIDRAAVDEDIGAYNRIWYQLKDGSFLYSGWVQPVRAILNEAVTSFPPQGLLGEVSVPYTDAHETPDPVSKVVYRLYYETVHWALEAAEGADGNLWYRLLDDKYEQYYYAPARHIRILPAEELAPISPSVPPREKRIEARLGQQLVLAYEAERLVFAARAATGAVLRGGTYTTPLGRFWTYYKRPTRHMAAGDLTASGFDLPGVPWVMYIKENGVSMHGTYWHNDFGRPRSHGCINLSPSAAKWLFRWSLPVVPLDKQYEQEYQSATRVDVVE